MDWNQLLLFAILGLGAGVADRRHRASAIVLTYRGSGIINLATGAIAMLGGYSYWSLKTGDLRLVRADGGGAASSRSSFLVVLGVLIEFVAFRPLRTASPLAKLAASLGVLLVAQASVSLAFGIDTKPQPPVLPRDTVKLLGAIVPVDRLILPAIVARRDARALAPLQAQPLRARDARGLGERGRRDAARPLAEPARAREHACSRPSSPAGSASSPPRSPSSTRPRCRCRSCPR